MHLQPAAVGEHRLHHGLIAGIEDTAGMAGRGRQDFVAFAREVFPHELERLNSKRDEDAIRCALVALLSLRGEAAAALAGRGKLDGDGLEGLRAGLRLRPCDRRVRDSNDERSREGHRSSARQQQLASNADSVGELAAHDSLDASLQVAAGDARNTRNRQL